MKIAGINTVEAIMQNIKGDMSKLTDVVIPTFGELYENLETLDQEKEDAVPQSELDGYEAAIDAIFQS